MAYRTDLMFVEFDGDVRRTARYVVAQRPRDPSAYWDNFLLFDAAPEPGDLEHWERDFRRELDDPRIGHLSFGWDDPSGQQGDARAFADAGFTVIDDRVLVLDRPQRERAAPAGFVVRRLEGDVDWAAMAALTRACDLLDGTSAAYDEFRARQRERWRAMAEAGLGHWLGAFAGERLVGHLGVFARASLARLQCVETHPRYRRRGVCAALVSSATAVAFDRLSATAVVTVAEDGGDAERIYRRAGFVAVERQVGVFRPSAI